MRNKLSLLTLLFLLTSGNVCASDPTGLIVGLTFMGFVIPLTCLVLILSVIAYFDGKYRDPRLAVWIFGIGCVPVLVGLAAFALNVYTAGGINNQGFDQSLVKLAVYSLIASVAVALLPLVLARLPRPHA